MTPEELTRREKLLEEFSLEILKKDREIMDLGHLCEIQRAELAKARERRP
jgi:hypothetical protein